MKPLSTFNRYKLSIISDMDIIILHEYLALTDLISSLKSASLVNYQDGDKEKIKTYQEMRYGLVRDHLYLFNRDAKRNR